MIDIYNYAKTNNIIRASAVPSLRSLKDFFRNLKINIAVEIGTFYGISATWIAQFSNEVHTFDIRNHSVKDKVWKKFKVEDKIFFHLIKGRGIVNNTFKDFEGTHTLTGKEGDIKAILDTIDFDFAFIDGSHTYEDVKADFELVKHCGRVLFHDVVPEFKGVHKFIKEIGVKVISHNVGYWQGG